MSGAAAAIPLITSASFPVFADHDAEYPDQVLDSMDFSQENAEVEERGKYLAKRRGIDNISGITHFYQDDGSAWCNAYMENEHVTIRSKGCCLVSFAMIQHFYDGVGNPGTVNSTMGINACLKGSGFQYSVAASKYNYTIANYLRAETGSLSFSNFIIGAVDLKRPVLVGMKNSAGGTHFVFAYGYAGTTILIYDPGYQKNYTTLQQYMSEGYYVNRLYTYTK